MNLPELGVGVTWLTDLDPVLDRNARLIDFVEVEPQMFWRREPESKALVVDPASLRSLRERRMPKLIHSIGLPVGGTCWPRAPELTLLRRMAIELEVPWCSEHLSFNRVEDASGSWQTGFLLPPRQTLAGVEAAVASIRTMTAVMPMPLAIETGVSYLRPRADELPDGDFVARVSAAADCGILLDLHNICTNQHSGRQTLREYLEQLPLERVWEVHLGGGSTRREHWLEARSSVVPEELLDLAARIVPRLPNLKALVLELFPPYHPSATSTLQPQLEILHRLWDRRHTVAATPALVRTEPADPDPAPSPTEWESTLAALTAHKPCSTPVAHELRRDPGLAVIREMVEQFRGSMVLRTLRLSSRLIMLERGPAYLEQLLAAFWKVHPPEPFAIDEAEAFAAFLLEHRPYVPFLTEVLAYDRAVIAVALHGEERLIPFRADPLPLLHALSAGRRPTGVTIGEFEVLLTPDEVADTKLFSQMQVIH